MARNHLPDKFGAAPWVRWPPAARLMPSTGVARLDRRQHHRLVGLRARMGLHVGEAAAKDHLRPVDRQLLHHVHLGAAAVVAAAGVALGVFIGQHGALRLQHRGRDDVLARDQLDAFLLAMQLPPDRRGQLRIGLREGGGKEAVRQRGQGLLVHGGADPNRAASFPTHACRRAWNGARGEWLRWICCTACWRASRSTPPRSPG